MESRSTRMFELKKGKRIGQVLFIVEGEKTEPNLIYRVFSGIRWSEFTAIRRTVCSGKQMIRFQE